MLPVFVTLGSNMNPERNITWAAGLLKDTAIVEAMSRVYRSVPLGRDGQPLQQDVYLNAAVLISVPADLPPDVFKYRVLRPIEDSMGRVRTSDKFAPRPIDLDIALYSDLVTDAPLVLPDPEILTRAHVALPLADLAPHFEHPVVRETLAVIAARFQDTPGIERAAVRLD